MDAALGDVDKALLYSISKRNSDAILACLKAGANPEFRDGDGQNALELAKNMDMEREERDMPEILPLLQKRLPNPVVLAKETVSAEKTEPTSLDKRPLQQSSLPVGVLTAGSTKKGLKKK